MTERLNLSDINIPGGMLHDHKLTNIKDDGNRIILSFDFYWMNDYVETEYTSKFKDCTKCEMVIELNDDFGEFALKGSVKRGTNKYNCLALNIDDFVDALNCCSEATFLSVYTNGYVLIIEFAVSFYNCKNYFKRFKRYGIAKMEVCAKSITCSWQ